MLTERLPIELAILMAGSNKSAETPRAASNFSTEVGSRNTTLTSLAGSLLRRGEASNAILAALIGTNAIFPEPLSNDEVENIVRSVARYEQGLDLTEHGVSKLVGDRYAGTIKYSSKLSWLYYNGQVWVRDRAQVHVRRVVAQLLCELETSIQASRHYEHEEREVLLKRITGLKRSNAIAGVAKLAMFHEGLLDESDWKEIPNLVNFQNGTLVLPELEFRAHDPSDRLLKVLEYDYDPTASCPNFDRALRDALPAEDADFLMRVLGHSVSGEGGLQKMLILIGSGRNGKTTILEAVARALGSYSVSTDPTSLMKTRETKSINNDVAALAGARLVTTSELNPGQVFDAGLIKRLTGNDRMTARFLYGEYFDFVFRGLLVMASNTMPLFDGSDGAMGRRLLVLRFPNTIEITDPSLPGMLASERAGIMNRLIEGYRRWREVGVNPPASVIKETDEAIRESNQVLEFLEACCEEKVDGSAPAGLLYTTYYAWCSHDHGIKPMSRPAFKAAMERTLKRKQGRGSGNRFWSGVVLKKG